MQSLIDLLAHPYWILNHVAETIYEGEGAAFHQRLRSRLKGRHRFTVEDYKALRKHMLVVSRRLDGLAERIRQADPATAPSENWVKRLQHPWINQKPVFEAVGKAHGLSYLQVYDALRNRTRLPEGFLPEVAEEYHGFASWIRDQLDLAREEKKAYRFSQGRGGASHSPEKKSA